MPGKDETVREIKRMTEGLGYGHWRLPVNESVDCPSASRQVGSAIQHLRESLGRLNGKDVRAALQLIEQAESQLAKVREALSK